jgi:predicted nuclease with TOPRIM domain
VHDKFENITNYAANIGSFEDSNSTNSIANDTRDVSEAGSNLRIGFQLLWAKMKNVDLTRINLGLQHEIHAVKHENSSLKEKLRDLEAGVQTRYALGEKESLQKRNEELTNQCNTLKIELDEIKVKNLGQQGDSIVDLKTSYAELTGVNDRLHAKIDAFQTRIDALVKEKGEGQKLINQISLLNIGLNGKIEKLTDKIDRLSTENIRSQEQARKITVEKGFFRSKNANLEGEIGTLRNTVQTANSDRDWHRSEHLKLLEERNARNAERNNGHSTVDRLKGENRKLKEERKNLMDSNKTLKDNIAFYITQLDLADAGHRVFNCFHDDYGNIPDGLHMARAKFAGLIATEFHNEYAADEEYMQLYGEQRQDILDHHRAHEYVGQQKGDNSSLLRNTREYYPHRHAYCGANDLDKSCSLTRSSASPRYRTTRTSSKCSQASNCVLEDRGSQKDTLLPDGELRQRKCLCCHMAEEI